MNTIRALAAGTLLTMMAPAGASIEIYDVDPAYRQEVYQILTRMLTDGPAELDGRVQLLPTGQLLVDTNSDARQAEIAGVLEAIANREPQATPTVTLRYWVLQAVPGGVDASGVPEMLDGVVEELEAMYGDLGVQVLDAATVTSGSGQGGGFQNDQWEIFQNASVNADRLNASVVIDHELQELHMELSLTRGEFVVLGAGTSSQIVENGVLAVIVNWPEE